jgi:chloride channel 7
VAFCHPLAAGSGLPELKGYLNGNPISGLYGNCFNWIRPLGAVLATGAGLPVDREGPLISIGGAVGVGTTTLVMRTHFMRWISNDRKQDNQGLLMMDEESFSKMKQIGAILGSAAGLAVAYNAPVGGVLYMLEEVTLNSWPEKLTTTCGVTVVIAVFLAKLIIEYVYRDEVHALVIFNPGTDFSQLPWNWIDLPLILFVGVLTSVVSAIFSCGLLNIWRLRHSPVNWNWRHRYRCCRVLEAVAFTTLCVIILNTLPQLVGNCKELPDEHTRHGRIMINYTCPTGYYNQLATLFMQGEEGAVKTLFARDTVPETVAKQLEVNTSSSNHIHDLSRLLASGSSSGKHGNHASTVEEYDIGVLLVCLLVYLPLSVCTAGLSLPMGYFVPSMFLGALVGRTIREIVGHWGWSSLAHAGVYAFLGSAASLACFTHMTLAIVVLLAEVAHDINLVGPLMLVVLVSRYFNKMFIRHPYDEQLIIDKKVPYLEAECPHHLDKQSVTAGSLCCKCPTEAVLHKNATIAQISHLLCLKIDLNYFPVVNNEGTRCIGIIHRNRLQKAIDPDHDGDDDDEDEDSCYIEEEEMTDSTLASSPQKTVDVMLYADPAPHCVLEDMPIVRLYKLFSSAGISAVCVLQNNAISDAVGNAGILGILSRRHIVNAEHAPKDRIGIDHDFYDPAERLHRRMQSLRKRRQKVIEDAEPGRHI